MNDPVCACVDTNHESLTDVKLAAAPPCGSCMNNTGSVFPVTAEPQDPHPTPAGPPIFSFMMVCVKKKVLSGVNPFKLTLF